jgi:hypothetical protein
MFTKSRERIRKEIESGLFTKTQMPDVMWRELERRKETLKVSNPCWVLCPKS